MELALVSGRGPPDPGLHRRPRPARPGCRHRRLRVRDEEEAAREGGRDIRAWSLDQISSRGVARAASRALARFAHDELARFWIHLDADVLDDRVMPAVDYRTPGGLSLSELTEVLGAAIRSGRAVGLTITIFNPSLDPDGGIAHRFASSIAAGLRGLQD
jgi:arginase